jgi:hypothetical protein
MGAIAAEGNRRARIAGLHRAGQTVEITGIDHEGAQDGP